MNASKTFHAAVLKEFGAPPKIDVETRPLPKPGPGRLLLKMHAAPVNPADLNILEGKYGELPALPAVVGNEGVGTVLETGDGVAGFAPGDWVLPMARGTWCSCMETDAETAIRLPSGADADQLAMLSVNPATALLLLRILPETQPGSWIVQNAANSGVGRSVIQLARHLGIRTINVVRRPELIEELKRIGADAVLLEDDDIRAAVAAHCGKAKPLLALNSVGGQSALNLANALGTGGTVVTFGAMGRQPIKVPNGLLIFRDLRFRGFWLTRWLKLAPPSERTALYSDLAGLVRDGKLVQPIAQKIPLGELHRAIALAAEEKRNGKILLDLRENH